MVKKSPAVTCAPLVMSIRYPQTVLVPDGLVPAKLGMMSARSAEIAATNAMNARTDVLFILPVILGRLYLPLPGVRIPLKDRSQVKTIYGTREACKGLHGRSARFFAWLMRQAPASSWLLSHATVKNLSPTQAANCANSRGSSATRACSMIFIASLVSP